MSKLIRVKDNDQVGLLITKNQAKLLYICLLKGASQTPGDWGRLNLTQLKERIQKEYPQIKFKSINNVGELLEVARTLGDFWNEDNQG